VEHQRRWGEAARFVDAELWRRRGELDERAAAIRVRAAEVERRDAASARLRQLLVHDLKNPISVIKSNVAYLLDEPGLAELRSDLHAACDAIDGAHAMALGLLAADEELAPAREPVALLPLLARTAIDQADRAKEAGVLIEVAAGPPAVARADATLLSRVITNLVENALRHAHARRVLLSVEERPGGAATLVVEDDGVGIPAAARERLAEAVAAHAAVSRRVGLGLRFCAAAAAAHGGRLVIADRPSRGTSVRVEIA
jgi:signal transduction histidine kinase